MSSPCNLHYLPFASRFALPHFSKICPFIRLSFLFAIFLPDLSLCATLFAVIIIMDSSSCTACTPENEVLNFKQRGGENLKDAWYRIRNAHN